MEGSNRPPRLDSQDTVLTSLEGTSTPAGHLFTPSVAPAVPRSPREPRGGSSSSSAAPSSSAVRRVREGSGCGQFCLLAGSASVALAQEVAQALCMSLTRVDTTTFADGECGVAIRENVRSKECFVIQSTSPPVNDSLVELCLIGDALKRAACKRITAIIPYYGYARQDRKTQPRVPISAALVARLIEAAGINHIFALDLHCGQIQGFFDIPVDNLYGSIVLKEYFLDPSFQTDKLVVVSPDAGGVERADNFREYMRRKGVESDFAVINKRRKGANKIASMELIGSVEDAVCIIVDDMIDTAGTLCAAAQALADSGARSVYAVASHGLFSTPAHERITASVLEKVIVLNTIAPKKGVEMSPKIVMLSVGQLLATAISVSSEGCSLSNLFD